MTPFYYLNTTALTKYVSESGDFNNLEIKLEGN